MTYTERKEIILEAGQSFLTAACAASFDDAITLFENLEPPAEWVVTEVSKLNSKSFSYVPIGVMEIVLGKVFDVFEHKIGSVIISQDKSKFAVTTTVIVEIGNTDEATNRYFHGTATEIAPSIEHLQLATPLSRKKAVGNALRNQFALFGKYLNWETTTIRDESVADILATDQPTDNDVEFNRLVTAIKEAPTKAAAQVIIDGAGSFRNALPFNSEVKASINSKPE